MAEPDIKLGTKNRFRIKLLDGDDAPYESATGKVKLLRTSGSEIDNMSADLTYDANGEYTATLEPGVDLTISECLVQYSGNAADGIPFVFRVRKTIGFGETSALSA